MPVWQFNAATNPADEIADSARSTINTLDPTSSIQTPASVSGWLTTQEVSGARIQTNFLNQNLLLDADSLQRKLAVPLRSALPAVPVPLSPEYKTITTTLALVSGEPTVATRYNDTLRRTATLANYYAYDDGTPEVSLGFGYATGPAATCMAFDLNVPDQVGRIEIYLAGGALANTALFADVWPDDPQRPGFPGGTALAHVAFRVPTDSILLRTGRWYTVNFPPVPVSGRFYVGYSIQVPGASVAATNIGYDLNNSVEVFQRTFTNPWVGTLMDPRFEPHGVLMIRAYTNQNGALGLPAAAPAEYFPVFPNPVSATGAAELHMSAARGSHRRRGLRNPERARPGPRCLRAAVAGDGRAPHRPRARDGVGCFLFLVADYSYQMASLDITSPELNTRLDAGERPFILDVREPWEHEQAALPTSTLNIPLNSLPGRLDEIADHQDDEIIVYCRSGARSATAKAFLQQQGYANVRNLLGGILGWEG